MYGAIIYQKAPIVMRHLEALLGADNFRDGLREYLKAHAFGNATWSDLIAVLDRAHADRSAAMESRAGSISRAGRSIETHPRGEERQDQRGWRSCSAILADRNLVWPQQLRVTLGYGGLAGPEQHRRR